jgi:regulator of protease activity HflC (stomatin/prohibitin superfamily)
MVDVTLTTHFADVSITHLTFSKEFTKAIEQKQVAEQDAERQMYVVQRVDQERKVNRGNRGKAI